jgi:Fur family peroxide stress response transcriptional regulator
MSADSYLQMSLNQEETREIDAREIERRVEQLKQAARQAGVKLTHQRIEIFREVAASIEHPSAEMVLRAVQPRMPTVSLDTVYRTLWLLADLGLVSTLGPKRASVRFDANLAHHHHYVCMRCGLARDFESTAFDALPVPKAVEELGSIVSTHMEVRGVCRRCLRAEAQASAKKERKEPKGKERSKA